jgi:hypothetical protein
MRGGLLGHRRDQDRRSDGYAEDAAGPSLLAREIAAEASEDH